MAGRGGTVGRRGKSRPTTHIPSDRYPPITSSALLARHATVPREPGVETSRRDARTRTAESRRGSGVGYCGRVGVPRNAGAAPRRDARGVARALPHFTAAGLRRTRCDECRRRHRTRTGRAEPCVDLVVAVLPRDTVELVERRELTVARPVVHAFAHAATKRGRARSGSGRTKAAGRPRRGQ